MSTAPANRRGVRYVTDTGEWTMRCDSCRSRGLTPCHWPLTLDFWDPDKSLMRCRACWVDYDRRRRRSRTARERNKARSREYYAATADVHRLKARHRYQQNRDAILARRRELHAAKRAA